MCLANLYTIFGSFLVPKHGAHQILFVKGSLFGQNAIFSTKLCVWFIHQLPGQQCLEFGMLFQYSNTNRVSSLYPSFGARLGSVLETLSKAPVWCRCSIGQLFRYVASIPEVGNSDVQMRNWAWQLCWQCCQALVSPMCCAMWISRSIGWTPLAMAPGNLDWTQEGWSVAELNPWGKPTNVNLTRHRRLTPSQSATDQ